MRRYLITGASSDVGVELIKRICREGLEDVEYIFATHNLHSKALQELAEEYPGLETRLLLFRVNLKNKVSVEKLIKEIERIGPPTDIVHLPSAPATPKHFKKSDWEDFKKHFELSVRSITVILLKFLPEMAKNKKGKVVFMLSSYVADAVPPSYLSPYVTGKYALLGLMKSLAGEYADKGIQINAVSPSMMDTKFVRDLPDIVKEQATLLRKQGRLLKADEAAAKIVKLLKQDNKDNGKNLVIR